MYRLVARRGDQQSSGAQQRVDKLGVEAVFTAEVGIVALAEGDDTGAVLPLGVVEDVLEAQRIDGRGVAGVVFGGYVEGVGGHGVADGAEVGARRHAHVGRAGARPGGYAERVGAVGLGVAVGGVWGQLVGAVVAAYGPGAAHGVGRQLVPEAADAAAPASIEKGGMGEVEAYVHDAQHDATAIVGLGQGAPLVDGQRMGHEAGGVHGEAAGARGLDTAHQGRGGKRLQARKRYQGDAHPTLPGQQPAIVVAKRATHVALHLDEGAKLPFGQGSATSRLRPLLRGCDQLAYESRHLLALGMGGTQPQQEKQTQEKASHGLQR